MEKVMENNKKRDLEDVNNKIYNLHNQLILEEERLIVLKQKVDDQILLIEKIKKQQKDANDHLQKTIHRYSSTFITDVPTDVLKIIVNYCNYSCGISIGRLACINRKLRELVNQLRTTYAFSIVHDPNMATDYLSKSIMPCCQDVIIRTWYCDYSFISKLQSLMNNNVNPNAFLDLSTSKHDVQFDYHTNYTVVDRLTFIHNKNNYIDPKIVKFFNPSVIKISHLEDIKGFLFYLKTSRYVSPTTFIVVHLKYGKVIIHEHSINITKEISKSKLKELKLFPGMPITRITEQSQSTSSKR